MVNSADELLALTQSKQEEWFQSHLKEQFIQSLMDCPIVAMSVQIDDVHKELVSNLTDYNHGHEFIQSHYVFISNITKANPVVYAGRVDVTEKNAVQTYM